MTIFKYCCCNELVSWTNMSCFKWTFISYFINDEFEMLLILFADLLL